MSPRDLGFLKLNDAPLTGLIPAVPMEDRIPKILHHTSRSEDLPTPIARNIAEIRTLNPGWRHRFYDNDDCIDYIRPHYGEQVLSYYLRISKAYGAARADLFRYLALYKEGRVYLDVKSGVGRPFDDRYPHRIVDAEDDLGRPTRSSVPSAPRNTRRCYALTMPIWKAR